MEEKKIDVEIFPGEEDEVISLIDDDGNEIEFLEVAGITYQGQYYTFLQPLEEDEFEEGEVAIFKVESQEDGENIYVTIEDEKLVEELFLEFQRAYADFETGHCGCSCEDCEGDCDCDDDSDCEGECDCEKQ